MEKKKREFDKINELEVSDKAKNRINDKIAEYPHVYFPDNSKFTPMQKLENVFTQIYTLKDVKYSFGILGNENNLQIYQNIIKTMLVEAYVMRNQADIEKVKNEVPENTVKKVEQDGV